MVARKRALVDASNTGHKSQDSTPTKPPTAPLNLKSGLILKLSLLLLRPYLSLIFHHYKIERDVKKSILVNVGFSLAGFFVTRKMITVASNTSSSAIFLATILTRRVPMEAFSKCLSHWVLLLELFSWSWPSYFSILTSHPIPIRDGDASLPRQGYCSLLKLQVVWSLKSQLQVALKLM
ncbi:hypothetical protein F2P56_021715 [Juglans regia]|uniref:Uncharacterized protein n=1 Tax=Juglans regia TaxID=51240 RepID=A0A833TXV4_JUGRE|nr:hypothetical protein F2P56_021715 [Juglans regia]